MMSRLFGFLTVGLALIFAFALVGCSGGNSSNNPKEEEEAQEGELWNLHLQGVETSSPRHWHLRKGHVDHEQFRERHLRKDCR